MAKLVLTEWRKEECNAALLQAFKLSRSKVTYPFSMLILIVEKPIFCTSKPISDTLCPITLVSFY